MRSAPARFFTKHAHVRDALEVSLRGCKSAFKKMA